MSQSLVDRVEGLIDSAVAAGRFRSRAHFLREAGLSGGYLASFKTRTATDPTAGMTADVVRRIALQLGMTTDQVVAGANEDSSSDEDAYPERAWAVIAARALRYPETAIQTVLGRDPGEDPGRLYWFRSIEAEVARVREQLRTKRRLLEDEMDL